MIHSLRLKAIILEKGYTQRTLSERLGINKNTLNSKINGNSQFNIDEVDQICKLLDINSAEEKCSIFLHNSSQ